jgi:hypothetical protein
MVRDFDKTVTEAEKGVFDPSTRSEGSEEFELEKDAAVLRARRKYVSNVLGELY